MKNEDVLIVQHTSRHVDIMHVGELNKKLKTLLSNIEYRILVKLCHFTYAFRPRR